MTTNCRRSTETPLASGTIRELTRRHCTSAHRLIPARFPTHPLVPARGTTHPLVPARGTTTFPTNLVINVLVGDPVWGTGNAPTRSPSPTRPPIPTRLAPTRLASSRVAVVSPCSPRHPCQTVIKRRVP